MGTTTPIPMMFERYFARRLEEVAAEFRKDVLARKWPSAARLTDEGQ
jgi:hypothetical protein